MSSLCRKSLTLSSLEKTIELGRHFGSKALPGDIITLSGDLGAGKTTLTQAIGQGMGVPGDCYITSPTFSLLHEYPARIPLYHMDLYRLGGEEEFIDLGFEEYLYGNGLSVIEWPDRLSSAMPESRLHIELTIINDTSRHAELTGYGDMAERLSSFIPSTQNR